MLTNPPHWSWTAILSDPVRLALLQALCELREPTIAALRERCHSSDPTLRRHLEALEALGLVHEEAGERDGLTPGRPASRFVIDSGAAAKVGAIFELLSEPLAPTPAPGTRPPAAPGTAPESCRRPTATA